MLFSTANIGFGRSFAGVGDGGFSLSLVGLFGADGLWSGVGAVDAVSAGDGVAMMLDVGYLLLVSASPLRVISHVVRTPEAPSTRTIANTHGKAPLLDSPLVPSALRCL
jgi:hypothetical protein